ncbi:MAG: arginine--tRNA ligase [Eubacteriales Family XIII. Incertae Sedis bacterium]|nr:MAG: arginine--tRNA ligase [Clostridiales Family XIII bacterium]
MINYKEEIAKILADADIGLSFDEIKEIVEVPSDSKMGDYAFPCFKLAKVLRKAPPMIAKDIAEKITGKDLFEKVESVNAYVNMYISKQNFIEHVVPEIVNAGDSFGRSNIGEGRPLIVEYSSPNICKPFHIGHIRSTVIGNALYKIYDAIGYDVIRINHLGDYGTQFGKMIVAYRLWGNKEDVEREPIKTLLSYYTKFHVEVETHPELDDEARKVFVKLEAGEKEEVELWQWFREMSLKEFNRVYDMLDIKFDSYNGESFYSDKMPRIVNELKEKGLLQESQGAQVVDLSEYGMPPALVTKSDGSSLYLTRDIAAAVYRKETYNFVKNIYVVASQQNLHFQQWFKVVELLGYEWAKDCVHVPFGMVSLEDGTMSTRHGRVVFLEDVLNKAVDQTREIVKEKGVNTENLEETAKAVGIGAVIFQELSNNRIKDYVFSWERVLNFEGETGPYVQYTHARACSVLRNAGEELVAKACEFKDIDFSYLTGDAAYTLVKLMYELPDVIADAAEKYEPSVVTRHLIDIAQGFNRFYHEEHILVDNEAEKLAKVALVKAAKNVIANGLALLGMKAPEKM